jgi:hypothetical protein
MVGSRTVCRGSGHAGQRADQVRRLFFEEDMMKKTTAIASILLVPTLLAGCEDDDDDLLGLEDCASLEGNFRATEDFGFTGATDESLIRDFDEEGTTFTLALRSNRTFESRFTEPGIAPLVRTGAFTAGANELALGNQALFTGAEDVEQRFVCERLSENRFRLESTEPVGFDFDEDEVIEEDEEGIFEGEFELF